MPAKRLNWPGFTTATVKREQRREPSEGSRGGRNADQVVTRAVVVDDRDAVIPRLEARGCRSWLEGHDPLGASTRGDQDRGQQDEQQTARVGHTRRLHFEVRLGIDTEAKIAPARPT